MAADAYANGSGGNDLLPALWVGGSFQQKPANSPMEITMILTLELLKKAKTKKGGYSLKQIEMGTELAGGTPWLRKIVGKDVIPEWWQKFNVCKGFDKTPPQKPEKGKVLNAMPAASGWEWKPNKLDVPPLKISTPESQTKSQKKRIKKQKKKVISRADNEKFYISREWRELRARVLEMYECRCMMCGRSPKQHKVIIHVDHIRPRSKHPDLSLEITNLQLLCEDCNLGKSNKYDTDWRPE